MPRSQGTSRKGKPKKSMRDAGFGKALERCSQKRYVPKSNGASQHGQGMMATGAQSVGMDEANPESTKMKSVLDIDDLSDFLHQAQMANQEFLSEREQFLNIDSVGHEYRPAREPTVRFAGDEAAHDAERVKLEQFSFKELGVPRRPAWTPGKTTPEELDAAEKESFLEWRRGVANMEEQIAEAAFASGAAAGAAAASVTPYEKNLEVWRQLWRVLERSAVVIQIVDARNPLFYLSDDLRKYATDELGKPMLILVNKSDYLTAVQRKVWSEYFSNEGVEHLFFSAHEEQKKIDIAIAAACAVNENSDSEPNGSDDEGLDKGDSQGAQKSEPPSDAGANSADSLGITNPLTREMLLDALAAFAESHGCLPEKKYDDRIQYGMVGFPNVGKSSVINVLVGSSKSLHGVARVAVAAQPGKTKHFQTLRLPDRDDFMLCDCPGLVFPSFVSSTADMIAAGVYPIAQMRDSWPVVSLICCRIPREVLNAHYSIHIHEPSRQELREKGLRGGALPPPTAEELLGAYCVARSMLAPASGVPDYQRASKVVIRDYSEGKLLYCHSPPRRAEGTFDDSLYHRETLLTAIQNTKKLEKLKGKIFRPLGDANAKNLDENAEIDLDDFDSMLQFNDLGENKDGTEEKRGKSHKSVKKWGKKGRKLRNKDPYGCHSDAAEVQGLASSGNGLIANAGKYSTSGHTRLNYSGSRAAVQFESAKGKEPRNKT